MSGAGPRSLRLPATARSATDARRFVTGTLGDWGLGRLSDTAALLTSEVVTNAVLHARTDLRLDIRRINGGVQVSVADGSPRGPIRRRARADATTGRGVELLDALAGDWTVTTRSDGKTVTFTVLDSGDAWARADREPPLEGCRS